MPSSRDCGGTDAGRASRRPRRCGVHRADPARRRAEARLQRLGELAPLHNPRGPASGASPAALRPESAALSPASIPPFTRSCRLQPDYAMPASWGERWPLRRFGFHGLSHAYASPACRAARRPADQLRLSRPTSAPALRWPRSGRASVDTTMGFTPLEGLVMATRSGSVDPGLLLWVQRHGETGPGDGAGARAGVRAARPLRPLR